MIITFSILSFCFEHCSVFQSLTANTEKAEARLSNNNGPFKGQMSDFNNDLFPDSVNLNKAQCAGSCYNH